MVAARSDSFMLIPTSDAAASAGSLPAQLAIHLREVHDQGAVLSVVKGNEAAIALYEALNGRPAGQYIDPGPVWRSQNILFVWHDVASLISWERSSELSHGRLRRPPHPDMPTSVSAPACRIVSSVSAGCSRIPVMTELRNRQRAFLPFSSRRKPLCRPLCPTCPSPSDWGWVLCWY